MAGRLSRCLASIPSVDNKFQPDTFDCPTRHSACWDFSQRSGVESMAEPAAAKVESQSTTHSDAWEQALILPCRLTLDVPLPGFRVGDLLRLRPRAVINSHWRVGADVPLRANGKLIACGEFEVVGDRLAIRLTELV